MTDVMQSSFDKLIKVLESKPLTNRFVGYDPFDGLNSFWMRRTILGKSRFIRLVWVQLFKRSPLNFRRIAGIQKQENPQALAVFLKAYCALSEETKSDKNLDSIRYLADKICELKLTGWSGACWSYPFPWQARAFYQPKRTPLIIPTAYCVNALLDAFEITNNSYYKEVACSAGEFVVKDLNRTYEGETFAFSYSPKDKSVVYNASLMASQVLARIYRYTGNEQHKVEAEKSVRFCINAQKKDGSWTYGRQSFHQWIDNFHTGYNLVCLQEYSDYFDDKSIGESIDRGLSYYLNTFFDKSGFSRYFAHKKYPLDMNNPAQLVITLQTFGRLGDYRELVNNVMRFTVSRMQSPSGWFYYQKHRWFTNRLNYLRWSNAWMFYALVLLKIDDR